MALLDLRRAQILIARVRSWNKARLTRHRARSKDRSPDERALFCVMAIVKDEAFNIREWLDHYFWQGAAHIFIIDNGSTDKTIEIIEKHPRVIDITTFQRPRPYRQAEHYRHVFRRARIKSRFKWLVIADADEFWFDKLGKSLHDALQSLDPFDLVYCNWTIFGSSGYENHPASIRTDLTKCQPTLGWHMATKWAVKTDAIRKDSALGVHKVSGCRSTHTISDNERLQINHYSTQSVQYWTQVKMRRGDALDPVYENARNMRMFEEIDAACTTQDERLASMVRRIGL